MQQDTIENILNGDLDVYDAVVRQYQRMLLGYEISHPEDFDSKKYSGVRHHSQYNKVKDEPPQTSPDQSKNGS